MKASLAILWLSMQALCAASPQGQVFGWGDNGFGAATGDPELSGYSAGVVVIGGTILSNVVAVAAGGYRSLALKIDGTVVAWGYDADRLRSLSNITSIAASETHSLTLKTDGCVQVWPNLSLVQMDIPKGLANVVAIASGFAQSAAIQKDGESLWWGTTTDLGQLNSSPPPGGLTNVIAFALAGRGTGDNLALKRDGTLVEWPCRGVQPPITLPTGLSNVIAIATGNAHCLALLKDGTVTAWGRTNYYFDNPNCGQTDVPVRLSNVVAIAAGGNTSLALKNDGTVVSWGRASQRYSCPVPAGLSNVVAIAVGRDYCLAIQTNR
jgi:alpha-tubulin suppressor-like RCC1 family protein